MPDSGPTKITLAGKEQGRHVEEIGQNKDSGTSKTVLAMSVETEVVGDNLPRADITTDLHDHRLSTTPLETEPNERVGPISDNTAHQNPQTINHLKTHPSQPNSPIKSPTHQSVSLPTQIIQVSQNAASTPIVAQQDQSETLYPVPITKWKRLARNISGTQHPIEIPNPKRKQETLTPQDSTSEPRHPKQRRLNVSDEVKISSLAEAARQPRCHQ